MVMGISLGTCGDLVLTEPRGIQSQYITIMIANNHDKMIRSKLDLQQESSFWNNSEVINDLDWHSQGAATMISCPRWSCASWTALMC